MFGLAGDLDLIRNAFDSAPGHRLVADQAGPAQQRNGDAVGEAQRRRAEEVHVQITGPPEQRILEAVLFQVADPVRHVGLAADERLLPQRFAIALAPRRALNVVRQFAEQKLGTEIDHTDQWNGIVFDLKSN